MIPEITLLAESWREFSELKKKKKIGTQKKKKKEKKSTFFYRFFSSLSFRERLLSSSSHPINPRIPTITLPYRPRLRHADEPSDMGAGGRRRTMHHARAAARRPIEDNLTHKSRAGFRLADWLSLRGCGGGLRCGGARPQAGSGDVW